MELSHWSYGLLDVQNDGSYGLLSKTRGRVVERAWDTASQFFESCCCDESARHKPVSPAQSSSGACYAGVSTGTRTR